MLRVLVCVALLASGCALNAQPPAPSARTKTIVVTKPVIENVRLACPTDDQIKDAAIAASRATYFKAPRIYRSGSGACPCRYDVYTQDGVKRSCEGISSEDKKGWVMCRREQVTPELLRDIRAKMPDCAA
jgi:hypothetical protein